LRLADCVSPIATADIVDTNTHDGPTGQRCGGQHLGGTRPRIHLMRVARAVSKVLKRRLA
jgi:hypothetical protein